MGIIDIERFTEDAGKDAPPAMAAVTDDESPAKIRPSAKTTAEALPKTGARVTVTWGSSVTTMPL